DPSVRSSTRTPDRQTHPADHRRRPAGGAWLSVPRSAPPREEGVAGVEVGGRRQRAEARVQVLPPHSGRKKTARGRGVQMETDGSRDRSRDVAGRGGLRCHGGGATRISIVSCAPISTPKPKTRNRPALGLKKRATPRKGC